MEEVEEIVEVATNYFDSLFNAGVCDQIQECLNAVEHRITPDIELLLTCIKFTYSECIYPKTPYH